MRLTNYDRERILAKVVSTAFDKRIAANREENAKIGARILRSKFTEADWTLLQSIPREWLSRDYFYFNVKPDVENSSDYGQVRIPQDVNGPHSMRNTVVIVSVDEFASVKENDAEERAILYEKEKFRKQTSGVLQTFKTSEKLLAAWPSLLELMGEEFFEVKATPTNLPATLINSLDQILDAGRPFETKAAVEEEQEDEE